MATEAALSTVGEGHIWPTGGVLQPLTDCASGAGCEPALFEGSPWIFIILTLIIGGGCATMSGRALAVGWRSPLIAYLYGLLLASAVRFLHFGLLRGTLLSPYYFAIDAAVLMLLAIAAYRYTRASQMTAQYPWLYRRLGPFGWVKVDASGNATAAIAGIDRTG